MIALQERVHGVRPPQEWSLNKLHHVFTVRKNNKNVGMLNDNLLSLSYGRIINKSINTSEGLLPESFETYQIVNPGDIVMRLTYLQNDKRSLRQGLVKEKGIITSAYDAIYPVKGHDSRYWAYALLAMDLAKYYYSLGGGVRQSIKFKDFPNDWIYTPLVKTQKEIADFLDHETDRIDQLIEKKRRMAELLLQKQDSVRESAVCKGLKTDISFKDSAVDWFEKIPNHWNVCRFNRLIASKVDYRGRTPEKVDNGVFLVTARNIRSGKIDYKRSQEYTTIDDWEKLSKRGIPEIGDVIFTTEAPLGEVAQVDRRDVAFAQRIMKFQANQKLISNDFLAELIMSASFQRSLQLYASGSTAAGIKSERMAHLFGLIPPFDEQAQIVGFVRKEIDRLRKIISVIEASCERLREFRVSLITEALTGQLDIETWKKRGSTDNRLDKIEEAMRT